MGDIKVFTDAGINDNPSTVTSYNGQVTRISEFIENLQDLTNAVEQNTNIVQNITAGANPDLDSFQEVAENMDVQDFIDALNE